MGMRLTYAKASKVDRFVEVSLWIRVFSSVDGPVDVLLPLAVDLPEVFCEVFDAVGSGGSGAAAATLMTSHARTQAGPQATYFAAARRGRVRGWGDVAEGCGAVMCAPVGCGATLANSRTAITGYRLVRTQPIVTREETAGVIAKRKPTARW